MVDITYIDNSATICSRDAIELSDTAAFSPDHVFDGSYLASHDLYNDRKCYQHTSNINYQIRWENDILGSGAWVVTDDTGIRFYSPDVTPCPDLADWVYLPDGISTDISVMVTANIFGRNPVPSNSTG